MGHTKRYSMIFSEHLDDPDRALDLSARELDDALNKFVQTACDAWPELAVDDDAFIAHLAARFPADGDVLTALEDINARDLYLASACSRNEHKAMTIFTERYTPYLEKLLKRLQVDPEQESELQQQLLHRLLIARNDQPPAVALYAGQGSLGAYLRVAAFRNALKLLGKDQDHQNHENVDALLSIADEAEDPELAALKQRCRQQFKEAFQDSLLALSDQERLLLKYYYVSGLTVRQIAGLVGGNSSTIVRRLARVRASLQASTRQRLVEKLGTGQGGLQSIVNLVASQVDLSIARVLKSNKQE